MAEGMVCGEAKRAKTDVDDDEMEIEMDEEEEEDDDDNDGAEGSRAGVSLICSNLPPECNEQIVAALFGQ